MRVNQLLEDPFDKPWLGPEARRAALAFQTELLDIDDKLDVELVETLKSEIADAIINNGMSASFAPVMLRLSRRGEHVVNLLINYLSIMRKFCLYHTDTDFIGHTAELMYEHLRLISRKSGNEDIFEANSSPGPSTILARFARDLVAQGFQAEVKSSSKAGIINSSKLCIEVKGYGVSDSFKLYKPLWKHEQGLIAFVDVKTEKRFTSVRDMVDKLKSKYPKIARCLSYKPPPEKLSEATLNVRQRLLKFQQDLIDTVDGDVSDLMQFRVHQNVMNQVEFNRYVFVYQDKTVAVPQAVIIDDHNQIKVNGVDRAPDEVPLFSVSVVSPPSYNMLTFEELKSFNFAKSRLPRLLNLRYVDESDSGLQHELDDLIEWISRNINKI